VDISTTITSRYHNLLFSQSLANSCVPHTTHSQAYSGLQRHDANYRNHNPSFNPHPFPQIDDVHQSQDKDGSIHYEAIQSPIGLNVMTRTQRP
jgi:hypothetical protein